MPTFTNPNNVAIMCGTTPNKTGICGNYFYDRVLDKEVMMNEPSQMRAESIFAKMSEAGVPVTVVTTKDKLVKMLGHGLQSSNSVAVSVEDNMWSATLVAKNPQLQQLYGTDLLSLMKQEGPPPIYSAEASLYCLRLGAQLVRAAVDRRGAGNAGLFYFSTTDYLQHKAPPGSPAANAFYAGVDKVLGELDAMGAVVGLTADHGMNDKVDYHGEPKVVFVETVLLECVPPIKARVILPITDPYIAHHGSLGSFAIAYLDDTSPTALMKAMQCLREVPGIYTVMNNAEACRAFELPPDRIGDIVIVGDKNTVLGKNPGFHDLASVKGLRSHGSVFPFGFSSFSLSRSFFLSLQCR